MVDTSVLLDSERAAAYISDGLKEKRGYGWKNPVSSLGVAVKKGQIKPVDLPHSNGIKRIPKRYFTREECDRFVAGYRGPGSQPIDLSQVRGRFGQDTDANLAAEIGCSPRTIARERQRLGIPKYRTVTDE